MSSRVHKTQEMRDIFAEEERAVDELFVPQRSPERTKPSRPASPKPTPTHYKVVSISLYTEDIDRLSELVDSLKARGHRRANKSMVIREALRQIDLDLVPHYR